MGGGRRHRALHDRRRGDASRAAEIVAALGAHPDAQRVSPAFEVSPALDRRTRDELERDAVRDALERAAGLAAAAGIGVGGVISIGEPGPPSPSPGGGDTPVHSRMLSSDEAAGELGGALGELRPEPEPRSAEVPMRVALREAGGGGPAA